MAMNVGLGASGDPEVMIDINTTPLIDVMLVLLVMIIITIPIQLHSVNLNMPTGNPPPPLELPEIVKLDIDGTGAVYWNAEPMPDRATLEAKMIEAAAKDAPAGGAPATGQGRQVRHRRRRHGLGPTYRPDENRYRRQRAVHRIAGHGASPQRGARAQHGDRAKVSRRKRPARGRCT